LDKYGLSWQIGLKVLAQDMADPVRQKAKRVCDTMLKMVKFDIAEVDASRPPKQGLTTSANTNGLAL
jgi:hypothetical protein